MTPALEIGLLSSLPSSPNPLLLCHSVEHFERQGDILVVSAVRNVGLFGSLLFSGALGSGTVATAPDSAAPPWSSAIAPS